MRPAHLSGVGALRSAYLDGTTTPAAAVAEVYARIAARGDDGTWISLVPEADALAAADALDPRDLSQLPLFGIPYALKDNIDVAGLVTTAGCPDFGYVASRSAVLVERLAAAGAILVGKTNLDQFATGLNGTRTPYVVPTSVGDPALISGGSSSGSALAVAAGLVPFSIGTDTAGSGRVPAALNGIVGAKPSRGLVSTSGMVPACRSLDCASVFATSVADAVGVLAAVAGFDADDPWARRLPVPAATPGSVSLAGLRLGVPADIVGWGERGEQARWSGVVTALADAGAELVPLDMSPFFDAGDQLYQGAWLAERLDGLEDFLASHPDAVLPTIGTILRGGRDIRGVEVFSSLTSMQQLRTVAYGVLAGVDALLTPTVVETFTVTQMQADPIALNARLGRFTTFTNLLDLCALAIPAGRGPGGAPFGVTVQAVAGHDEMVASIGAALESLLAGVPVPTPVPPPGLELAVVGAHLRGMPLHSDLVNRGADLIEVTTTAAAYELHALAGTSPAKPGLRRVSTGGAAIEVEVYRLPLAEVGGFLATVLSPLAIGQLELADGRMVHGFVCEPAAFNDAVDITAYGGWRAYLAADRLTKV